MSNGCTQADLDQGIVCLTRGQGNGLLIDVEAGLISAIALVVVYILIFVSHNSMVAGINCIVVQVRASHHRTLVQRPMDIFLVSVQITCDRLWTNNFNGNSLHCSSSISSWRWVE